VVLSSTQLQNVSVTLWFRQLQCHVKRSVLSVFIDLCLQSVCAYTMDFVSGHKLINFLICVCHFHPTASYIWQFLSITSCICQFQHATYHCLFYLYHLLYLAPLPVLIVSPLIFGTVRDESYCICLTLVNKFE